MGPNVYQIQQSHKQKVRKKTTYDTLEIEEDNTHKMMKKTGQITTGTDPTSSESKARIARARESTQSGRGGPLKGGALERERPRPRSSRPIHRNTRILTVHSFPVQGGSMVKKDAPLLVVSINFAPSDHKTDHIERPLNRRNLPETRPIFSNSPN
jgi:hypothetical protein